MPGTVLCLKKLINKHIRINDEVFEYADNILKTINGDYNSIHIRRFIQYNDTIKSADDIVEILLKQIPKGSIVLDPFCGTGTTMLAAQKLGRKSIGIDISSNYLKLAQKRCRV